MDDVFYIPRRSDRLQELLNMNYHDAVNTIETMLSRAINKNNGYKVRPEKNEGRKRTVEYIIRNLGKTVFIGDLVSSITGLEKNSTDPEKMESEMNRYSRFVSALHDELPLFIRRTKAKGKTKKAAYFLDTKTINAFNEQYRDSVEFTRDYKGDFHLLLLDKLSKLN